MIEEPTAPGPSGPAADAAVQAALERLAEVSGLPPAERLQEYDEVHRGLAEALAEPAEGVQG